MAEEMVKATGRLGDVDMSHKMPTPQEMQQAERLRAENQRPSKALQAAIATTLGIEQSKKVYVSGPPMPEDRE